MPQRQSVSIDEKKMAKNASGRMTEEEKAMLEAMGWMNGEDDAMLNVIRYAEARSAVPWNQKTHREKITYYINWFFLVIVMVCILVSFFIMSGVTMLGIRRCLVSTWHVFTSVLFDFAMYLFTQEDREIVEL